MKLKFAKFVFLRHCSTVVIDCYTSEERWKQVNRFFIEYRTVARLEEQTEHCMPALWVTQATKTIFYCTLAVAFKLELIKQVRSQFILKIRYGIHNSI